MPEVVDTDSPRRGRPPKTVSLSELDAMAPSPPTHAERPSTRPRSSFFDESAEVAITAQPRQAPKGSLAVDGRVIYRGSNPHKTVVLMGSVVEESTVPAPPGLTKSELLEWKADNNNKIFKPVGRNDSSTVYDFSRYDTEGQERTDRLTKTGQVWDRCRNIWHFAYFMHAKDADGGPAFEVRVTPEVRFRIESFMRQQAEEVIRNDDDSRSVLKAMGLKAQELGGEA